MVSVQSIKNYMVALGPDHSLVRIALSARGRAKGFRVSVRDDAIRISRAGRVMLLSRSEYVLVPFMIDSFGTYFDMIVPRQQGSDLILDFSRPGVHLHRGSNVEIECSSIPEDDSLEAYTYKFQPSEGMTVFDAGANAGLTTFQLSRLVGPTGKVYALEPDAVALDYLERNIRRHGLENVEVCPVALSGTTGHAEFNMDGSLGAGLVDHIVYKDLGKRMKVETLTLEDFCMRIGRVPDYIKMDIEGAELSVVEASLEFLRRNPIPFALESFHHAPDGSLAYKGLERLFRSIDYSVESSDRFGWMFTWAMPPASSAPVSPGPAGSVARLSRRDHERPAQRYKNKGLILINTR